MNLCLRHPEKARGQCPSKAVAFEFRHLIPSARSKRRDRRKPRYY